MTGPKGEQGPPGIVELATSDNPGVVLVEAETSESKPYMVPSTKTISSIYVPKSKVAYKSEELGTNAMGVFKIDANGAYIEEVSLE